MSATEQLLTLAREFARAAELETSTASWRIFGDTKKLQALIDGGDIQTKRHERALQFLSDNWPEAAIWPADIKRPKPGSVEDGEAAA